MIRRIFVANRGEIAVRILRTCRRLGIETVLAASEADLESLPARLADKTICIGGPRSSDSCLNIAAIVAAAVAAGADAVHPGYGFLSENRDFARACASADLIFIGPTEAQLEAVGDKLRAHIRRRRRAAGRSRRGGGHNRCRPGPGRKYRLADPDQGGRRRRRARHETGPPTGKIRRNH
ncbi:acetyl/propionyl-CoA carboxylase alpha subunit [Rhodoblastus sphagnicola]|uniref:biotin carboxylase N-terminal domain-containing protein n=1 Tax=Rhodoblastus sphagnicola TaxID=333368 RepID=UPI0018008AE0|nr:biotin carboxylase N-terminal domain-containing protein [Rhodoblastus sphagnicola]MBB4200826.1 acetyl/propionyl-CoA carboxylase alpha subunit [Rhodoblastus sphagnicola]